MSPYLAPKQASRTTSVLGNGWHFGNAVAQRSGFAVHTIDVSRHAYTNRPALAITLKHADAISPKEAEGAVDDRRLAFAVSDLCLQPLTPEYLGRIERLRAAIARPMARSQDLPAVRAPDDVELVSGFESLGLNCELGFVQRLTGAEPLGLLRFAGLTLNKLILGLQNGFEGIGTAGRHRVETLPDLPAEGFIGRDDLYTMTYHTYRQPAEVSAEDLLAAEAERLPYLARKLMEDLEDGEKVFVVKNEGGLHMEDVLRVEAAIRERGPGLLLWVEGAEPGYPPGSVEVLAPGLMRGRVDRFANLQLGIHDVSQSIWLAMLRNAWALKPKARLTAG